MLVPIKSSLVSFSENPSKLEYGVNSVAVNFIGCPKIAYLEVLATVPVVPLVVPAPETSAIFVSPAEEKSDDVVLFLTDHVKTGRWLFKYLYPVVVENTPGAFVAYLLYGQTHVVDPTPK